MAPRVLLLMPTTTYKAHDFLDAARRLGVEVVVGTDRRQALSEQAPDRTLSLDFLDPSRAVRKIVAAAERAPLTAVLGVDDETVELAAAAAAALGLPHNPPDSAAASRDKQRMREALAAAGRPTPAFRVVSLDEDAAAVAAGVAYPCVLKPLFLSASRGVLRADDPAGFVAAFARIAAILRRPEIDRRGGERAGRILVESYIDGNEVSLEGLLSEGRLRVLALFDKPDMGRGPTFEETIFVTPSRLPPAQQQAVAVETAEACRALGLREGPVHAELRLPGGVPCMLELAARTIGGLCARALRFGAGISLEELILRHALGRDTVELERDRAAAGVMMLPIPRAGILRRVTGIARARAVAGVEDVVLSLHEGAEVVPLPEGHRYLGFIFARADRPELAERALRRAHAELGIEIAPQAS